MQKSSDFHKRIKRLKEAPIAIYILDESGLSIFSARFSSSRFDKLNDQLLGGFLTAINAFGREIFDISGAIDQIICHDFVVLMRKNYFTYCYICKGDPYYAFLTLEEFIMRVRDSPEVWSYLTDSVKHRLNLCESTILKAIIGEIFDSEF